MSAADVLGKLYKAPSAEECYVAAEELANYVNTNGLRVLQSESLLDSLVKATKNKKSGYEREAGAIGLDSIFTKVAGKNAPTPLGAEPWLLQTLPAILELYADKGDVVRQAAETAAGSLFALIPAEAAPEFLSVLYDVLGSAGVKWQAKVGALKLLGRLSSSASEQVGDELVTLIPYLTNAMHETKSEVSKQAFKTATKVCEACLDNKDIRPFIPDLVGCMAQPDAVAECIKKLSGTTFVAEVTGPALAVMVPLLVRALNERNQNVQRQTVVVVDNLCKLVRDPHQAAKFLPALTPGVERIEKGASFPEVREHAKSARETLAAATEAIGEDAKTEDPKKIFQQQTSAALDAILAVVQSRVSEQHANVKSDTFALTGLEYVARSIVRLADKRVLHAGAWNDVYVLPYLRRVCKDDDSAQLATDELRKMYVEIDKTRFGNSEEDDDQDAGECLCRTEFSLAYGGLLLLNHTTLKLYRGHRYGVVAANGSGKSTLLKAMRDGKVEGYPSQDQVRTLMVEHSLQGEDGSTPIIDFIANDKSFSSKSRQEIASKLEEVGFDNEKQQNPVSSLSGGWKMKLELARAMLSDAVVYLLDEPTNHLDVASIAWLENFLVSNNQITVVTVSHDSGFLDNICTDIIHYEKKKLRYYKGNLSDFVATKPEANAYYSLSATTVKFSFPPPGSLMGVRSNTRTILKASNCTFTYPGMSKPSLNDQSCAISLSSRVGVLGPNGAGKSTLIKVLTGEVVPQKGKVEKHPNLRIAMMAQHAFHHLEQHLEKSAVEYIAWRYQDGHDREMTEKASRKMTSEEKAQMETPITSKTGESRKVEFIVGRQKLKKSYQYEIKWVGYEHKHNVWIPRERLLELGFDKLVQQFDDFEASREGAGSREISVKLIRQHLEAVGLSGEIAQHHAVGGYSGGQKVKVVLAAAMWNNPQVLVLDEPTNYLDRDALGGLATAIRDWAGAVVIISHNMEFVGALCPEIWHVEGGIITSRSKAQLAEGAFADDDSTPANSVPGTPAPASTAASRLASRVGTPNSSAISTPVASDNEEDMTKFKAKKGKKKMSRNDKKAQEERRRLRLSRWLSYGGEREPDTEDEK